MSNNEPVGVELTVGEREILREGMCTLGPHERAIHEHAHDKRLECAIPAVERILATRQAPTVPDREAVAREIDRAFYQEGDSGGVSFRALAAADAVLALPGVTQAPTVALDVETAAAELFALGPYCGDMCGEWVTACAWCKGHYGSMAGDLVAVDPRRTEAEVKAEALREAADLCHHADQARCTWVDCPCRAINALAARIAAGAPDA